MLSRPLDIAAFLDRHGWGQASPHPFAGDFSSRRYARLTRDDGATAILMDADADQKSAAFVAIAALLRRLDIHAPQIFAADPDRGLILMQDFGIRNVGALIDGGAAPRDYYLRAAGILARLHRGFALTHATGIDLPLFNADLLTTQAELFIDAYIPWATGQGATPDQRQDFRAAWRSALHPLEALPQSLLLRDFMPDNLMELADGRLGVLDFQDAGIGCVAYDLASLCEEVRRDGGWTLLPDIVAHYNAQSASPLSSADLTRACVALSAQRHMRILGIVAGLAVKTGRRDKLEFLPRIRRHLKNILAEPALFPVREWMERYDVD